MNMTHKAIARSAGYYAEKFEDKWHWFDRRGWSEEASDLWQLFDTEEAAYKDCCEQCGLVEETK